MLDFAGDLWAMEPRALEALVAASARFPFAEFAARRAGRVAASKRSASVVEDGVATIPLRGPMLRGPRNEVLDFFGIEHTSQDETREALIQAAILPDIKSVVLDVDSPGGHASGTTALGAAVRGVRAAGKRVDARVSGTCASAALWVASQADSISAEPDAFIGSIGAIAVIADTSRMYENEGVKVHVIASGEHKGTGARGAPVTEAQLAKYAEGIHDIADAFKDAVASGRGLSRAQVDALATGECWMAPKALRNGLIDKVEAFMSEQETAAEAEDALVAATAVTASVGDLVEQLAHAREERDLALALADEAGDRALKAEAALAEARKEISASFVRGLADQSAAAGRPIAKDALDRVASLFASGQDTLAREIGGMLLASVTSKPSTDGLSRQTPPDKTVLPGGVASDKDVVAKVQATMLARMGVTK